MWENVQIVTDTGIRTPNLLIMSLLSQTTSPVNEFFNGFSLAAFKATTTNYDGDEGSCGGCKINLVHGVAGWAAAATPQSMQVEAHR